MDTTLTELVTEALLQFLEISVAQPLAGFALCTNDDLVTLFGMSITAAQLKASGQPELLFEPNDWPNEIDALFDTANNYLQLHLREADQPERRLRTGRISLSPETDPSEHLECLEERAIARLNRSSAVAKWRAFARSEGSR